MCISLVINTLQYDARYTLCRIREASTESEAHISFICLRFVVQ